VAHLHPRIVDGIAEHRPGERDFADREGRDGRAIKIRS
jgi:hypothetical protein